MSPEIRTILIIFHFLGVFLMAAPFYSLVVVNERAKFGGPPGYNTDRYMEQMITNQAIRCFAILAVVLVTGLILTINFGWAALILNWVLLLKWLLLVALVSLLSYVHFGIQPKINTLLASLKQGEILADDKKPILMGYRMRRKRLAGICLFMVLTALILGIRLINPLNGIIVLVLIALAGLFAWRVFKTGVRYGWI